MDILQEDVAMEAVVTEDYVAEKKEVKPAKRYFYAEINSDGVCMGIKDTSVSPDEAPECFVEIGGYDVSYLSRTYVNGEWGEKAEEEAPAVAPTQMDRIEALVSKNYEQIAQEAVDAYTLELIEGGVL